MFNYVELLTIWDGLNSLPKDSEIHHAGEKVAVEDLKKKVESLATVQLSDLPIHAHINYNGEIVGKEQVEKVIAKGERPILYTVSDEHIEAALLSLSEDRKAGRPPSDYSAPDLYAKRILY